jgi:molybdopterin synthase catalytic subunit
MNDTHSNIFVEGPVSLEFVAGIIQQYSLNSRVGAYSIFLGQVRGDPVNSTRVSAVEYSAQQELAFQRFKELQSILLSKYPNLNLHVYHSLGIVRTGEICFFVLTAGDHRRKVRDACDEAVERVKAEIPS